MNTTRHSIDRRRFLQLSAASASAIAVAGIAGPGVFAQEPPATASLNVPAVDPNASPQFRAVADAALKTMIAAKVPGVALGIYSKGRSEYAVLGVSDLGTKRMVSRSTRFQMGSINKTFTATAVMRLVEQNRIQLDAPVRHYLPNLNLADSDTAEKVTARQLLNHTAGWWGDRFVDTGDGPDAIARFVAEELPNLPQIAPVGKYVSYNNAAFVLAGRVLEVVDAHPYREAIQRLVLDPMDLESMTFDRDEVLANDHAKGYGPDANGETIETHPLFLPRNVDPAGNLWTNIEDLVRYGRFHMGDNGVGGAYLLSAESRREMTTPTGAIAGEPSAGFGVSWLSGDLEGVHLVLHDGGTFGQASLLAISPSQSFVLAILTNSQSGSAVTGAIQQEALKQFLEPQPPSKEGPASPKIPAALPLTEAQLATYAGHYRTPNVDVEIRIEDGRLVIHQNDLELAGQINPSNSRSISSPPLPVDIVEENTGIVGGVDNPLQGITFVRRENETIGWVAVGSRLYPRVS